MEDLVSIIMPNYNCEKFISEAINSVLTQTYQNWELIIVDDYSTDNSLKIIKDFAKKDTRIQLIINNQNKGAAYSRNIAIQKSKGEWIAFLDSDDIWLPNKLEFQLLFMKNNNYNFSYTNYEKIDINSQPLNIMVSGPKIVTKHKMLKFDYIGCLTAIYNANIIGLLQIDEDLKCRNDYALWLKASKKEKCYLLNETLAKYRVRKGTLSHSSIYDLIKNHYYLFRKSEEKNVLTSLFFTLRNVFYGLTKKILYIKKIKGKK